MTTTLASITIPPAALEAGARALCNEQRLFWPDLTKDEHDIIRGEARATFLAIVENWEGGLTDQSLGPIILPLYAAGEDR